MLREEVLREVLRRQCGLGGLHPGLEFEKGELGVAQGLRTGAVLLDQHEPYFLLEQDVALFERSGV